MAEAPTISTHFVQETPEVSVYWAVTLNSVTAPGLGFQLTVPLSLRPLVRLTEPGKAILICTSDLSGDDSWVRSIEPAIDTRSPERRKLSRYCLPSVIDSVSTVMSAKVRSEKTSFWPT